MEERSDIGYGGCVNWNYALYILLLAVIACRILLWTKFRRKRRRVGISTLQLLVVVAAMAILEWLPKAAWEVCLCATAVIIALSFLPPKRKPM